MMLHNEGIPADSALTCPLCAGRGDILYEGLRDRSWGAPGIWSFRTCGICGHIWLDPKPRSDDLNRLYASYYTHGVERPSPLDGEGLWPMCRRGVLEAVGYPGIARSSTERFLGRAARFIPPIWEECEQVVNFVPNLPRGKLLDVGCGDGAFLRLMRDLGWEVKGVEPDPMAAAVARGHGIPVLQAPIEQAGITADGFDVITTTHVIEHVSDPISFLAALRRALKPSGVLLVFTPNAESWGHTLFGRSWYPLEPPRHLHVFKSGNLTSCANRAGLRAVTVRTTSRLHLIFDASVSIRRSGQFPFNDPVIQASVADRLFRVIESFLVRVHPDAGEEIMMVCTK